MKNGAAIAIQSSGASTCLQDNDSLVSSCPLPEMPLENPISEDVPCIEKSELSNKANRVVELTTEVPSNVNKNNSDNAPEYVKSTFDGYVDENHPSSDVDDVRNTEDAESGHHKAGLDDVVVDDVDWSDDDDFSYYNFENDVHQCSSPVKPVSVRRLSPIRECSGSACSTPLPSSEEHERGNHMYLGSKELCLLKSQDSVKDSGGQTTTDASTSPDSDSLDDKQCDDISYSDGVALLADKRTERQLGSAPFHAYLSLTGCRSDTSDCEREPDPLPVYSRHAGNRYKKRTRTALYSSSYNRNGAPNAANHRSSPKSGEVYSCSGNSSSEDESMSKTKGRPPKGGGLFEQILSENKRKRRKKTMVKRKSETLPYHYDHDSWVSSKTFIQDRSLLHKGTHKADLESPASPPPLPRPSVSMRSFSVQSGSPIIPEVSFQGRCEETEVKNNDHYHWSGRPSNSFWLSPPHEQDSGVRDEGSDVYEPTSENFRMSLSRPLLDNSFVADSLEELRDVNRCGNNNQDKQAAVGRNNETCARRRAFDTSQSWPSCDSLTMVYMGPEWGSTETNIVASLQSLEDQEKSDVNSERLVDSGTGGSASTGSQHSSNGSSCRTGKTFTICKNMISEVPVYKWQRADTTTLPWVKYHKYYKSNPWALRGYSSEDLGSDGEPYSWKQDQIRGPVVDGTCHLWNESPGSTWAEVSTQTGRTNDTDSGIQTDATLQSDSTQTMAPFCSVATQSVQCATDVACQTDPMMESRGTQTDPILATGESQTVTVTEMQPISNAVYTPSKPEYGESFTCFCCPSGQEKTTASSSSGNFQCHEVGFSDNKAEAAPTFSDTGALGFPKVSFTEGEDSRSVPVPRCESGIYIGFHGDISELLDFDFKISLRDGVLTKSKRRDDKDVEHKSSLRASQLQNSTEEPVMNSKPNSPDCKEHEEEEGDHWEDQSTRVCTPESNQQNEISENAKEELSPTFESPKSFLNKDKRFATSSSSCFCHSNTGIASFGNGTTFDQDQIFNSSSVSTTQRSSVPIHETHGSKVCKTSSSLVQFDVLSEFLDDKLRAFEKSMKQWMAPWCEKLEALEDTVSVGDKMILKDRHRDLKQPIRRDVIPKVNSKNLNPLVLPWDEEYRTLPVPNRTLKNGVTTQKLETSGGTFCQQPTKCTCSLRFVPEEANSPPSSEFTVDAELDEHLPEDVLQLLKECREVRKKAWNEITLAHGQLRSVT